LKLLQKNYVNNQDLELTEKVIKINRVAKVVKGGRRFSFNALSVVGDGNGHIGIGFGKANEVPDAIRKSVDGAKKNIIKIERKKNTIPHDIIGKYKTTRVVLKPAIPGTGIKAADAVRSVVELAGISDILTKVHGSRNALNVVKATFVGLSQLMNHFDVAKMRDISIYKLWGQPYRARTPKSTEGGDARNENVESQTGDSARSSENNIQDDNSLDNQS
jgi:small subunit ribosomal protein S5